MNIEKRLDIIQDTLGRVIDILVLFHNHPDPKRVRDDYQKAIYLFVEQAREEE